ncbi:MAG: TolC family outer membrane protein [Pseudomonadota bacterium]
MRNWLKAAIVVAAGVLPVAAQAETLADALIAGYRNSNLLERNQALLRAADEDVAIAVSQLRPLVSYTARTGLTKSKLLPQGVVTSEALSASLTLSADLVLFNFGQTRMGVEVAKESVLATRQELVSQEQQVLFDVVSAYAEILLQQQIVALRQSNVRLITQELRAANDRFEVGEITRTDVAIAEAALAGSRANLAAAEGDLLVAREAYKLAVGSYPGRLAPLPPSPRIGKSLDEALAVALRTHPSIRQGQHLVKVADLQVEISKAAMKPSFGLGAELDVSGRDSAFGSAPNDTVTGTLGLSMTQTIYGGGRLSAVYRRALASKEAQRAGLHQTMAVVSQNLGNAWAGLGVFVASIDATERQIRAAQTAFDGVKEEATLGARTTLDVLDAEQELLDARATRLQAEASRYVAVYQILGAMGLLTAEHLQLGIPTYDPAGYYNAVKNAPATSAQGKRLDRILEKIGN